MIKRPKLPSPNQGAADLAEPRYVEAEVVQLPLAWGPDSLVYPTADAAVVAAAGRPRARGQGLKPPRLLPRAFTSVAQEGFL